MSDPNYNRRSQTSYRDDSSYTGWIIGAIVVLVIIVGGFMLFGRDAGTSSTADNTTRPATTAAPAPTAPAGPATTGPATTGPATTGSGAAR